MRYDCYWTLWKNGRILHRSSDFNKLLRYAVNEENSEITFTDHGKIVWVQNPDAYWRERLV